jgi:hypothetical protein
MPQFDKVIFFNQLFWLVLSFLFFYVVLVFRYLPKISRVLKIRNKKLKKSNSVFYSFQDSPVSNNTFFIARGLFHAFYQQSLSFK